MTLINKLGASHRVIDFSLMSVRPGARSYLVSAQWCCEVLLGRPLLQSNDGRSSSINPKHLRE
jgi:hypothetical protein